jgi:hypothetical protein
MKMLKTLFRKKSLPQEDGNSGPQSPQGRRVKRFDIILDNLEGSPEYELKHTLVIGREVGDIVINDPSISPRHATFTLQDEVVSIIDHGSQRGTFINGQKISVGKFVILEVGDSIKLGDLDLKIQTGTRFLDESEIPDSPSSKTKTTIIAPPPVPKAAKPTLSAGRKSDFKKNSKSKKKTFSFTTYRSANTFLRVLALVGDLFLAYILLILFLPFDDFKFLLNKIPVLLSENLPLSLAQISEMLKTEYQIPVDSLMEVYQFLNGYIEIYPLVVMYGILRIVSTLIFGTSFSQFMFGIRAGMNKIWARIGGVLRVLIGFLTWPFLIFDLPALFSRRTFKEVMTFTHLYNSSKLASVMGVIFYPILLLAAFIFAPLFQGFEMTEALILNPKVEARIIAAEDAVPADKIRSASSQFLQMAVAFPADEYNLIPRFAILGAGSKTKMEPGLTIFERKNLKTSMDLGLIKTFDLAALIELGLRGNPFLQDRFPALYEYAYTSTASIDAVGKGQDEKKDLQFEKELMDLILLSFKLSVENSLDIIQKETPILSGLVHFRSSLLGLLDGRKFNDGGFIKIGNTTFLKLETDKITEEFLLPLRPKGRLFHAVFSGETPQVVNSLKNKIYKFALFRSGWGKTKRPTHGEALNALEVIDAFSIDYKENKFNLDLAQALYGYYFERSGEVLTLDITEEKKLWISSLDSVLQILETMDTSASGEGEDARTKLLNNFRDLKTAFESGNKSFFGVSKVVIR